MSESVLQEYVLIWCRGNDPEEALLILKDRPQWQAGRLNLPGGKVEQGETPEEAARRELMEETGYECATEPHIMGKMVDNRFIIWILGVDVVSDNPPHGRPEETEIPQWINWSQARRDNRLLPNLRVIVPMCMTDAEDFIIEDSYRSESKDRHTIQISVCDQKLSS